MTAWYEKLIIWLSVCLFVIPACVSCTTHLQNKVRPAFQHEQFHDSVAILLTIVPDDSSYESRKVATAFAIDEEHLLTAGHFCDVIEDLLAKGHASDVIEVSRADQYGNYKSTSEGFIMSISNDHDVCLIYSAGHGLVPLPLVRDISIVEVEDPITIIGAPSGYFPVRREGRVITNDYRNRFLLAVGVQGGSSGSPVLWHGQVIGLISETSGTLIDGAIAVRSDHIDDFLRKALTE